jgi:hypothetical protein
MCAVIITTYSLVSLLVYVIRLDRRGLWYVLRGIYLQKNISVTDGKELSPVVDKISG